MSNQYSVKVQWGGDHAPWNNAGNWTIGERPNQHVIDIQIDSTDNGASFNGTVTYSGEGAIGFQAHKTEGHTYSVKYQWGGDSAPWNQGGHFILGDRPNQALIGFHAHSGDNGKTLHGTAQYTGEGPIGFQGTQH